MSDVMSQNEIDDLLSALSSGEVDVKEMTKDTSEKKVRKYDFSRPDKFAKEQLRTLEIIHENFSRLLNNFLSGYLRTYIEVDVLSVEPFIYSEFSNAIANPAILGIVDFAPLDGQIIVDVSADIAFAMIERVLGGSGSGGLKEKRALTEIERTLLRNILVKFINLLKEPWDNIIELKPKLENIETNSQFAQIISPSESIALVTFNLKIGEIEGMINLCIPHFVLEPILPNLSSKLWFSKTGKKEVSQEEKNVLEKRVKHSKLDMSVIVGSSQIEVREFLNLQIGDVILLNTKAEEELKLYVEGDLKFFGRPGRKNNKVALKITRSVEEGVEDNG